jgi:hypothetical protein
MSCKLESFCGSDAAYLHSVRGKADPSRLQADSAQRPRGVGHTSSHAIHKVHGVVQHLIGPDVNCLLPPWPSSVKVGAHCATAHMCSRIAGVRKATVCFISCTGWIQMSSFQCPPWGPRSTTSLLTLLSGTYMDIRHPDSPCSSTLRYFARTLISRTQSFSDLSHTRQNYKVGCA